MTLLVLIAAGVAFFPPLNFNPVIVFFFYIFCFSLKYFDEWHFMINNVNSY